METKGFFTGKNKKQNLILLGIIAVFSILYISLCFNYNLGVDEAYSVRTFNKDWPELIQRTAGDTHPPLYYFIARTALLIFGEQIPKFKLAVAVFGVLSLSLSLIYIKPRFGFRTAVGYMVFFFGIPYLTEYVIQIRMYSPLVFFVTWASLAAVEVYHKTDKKHWIILFIAALCACYTHNYGLLAAFVIYVELGVTLLIRNKKRYAVSLKDKKSCIVFNKEMLSWFISGVGLVVCFFPWMLILVHQMENMPEHFMAQPVTAGLILEILTDLFASGTKYTTYMFWFLLVIALVSCKSDFFRKGFNIDTKDNDTAALCMLGVFMFTLLLGIVLSLVITPLLMTRYMVSCLGAFSVFMAYGLQKLSSVQVTLTKKCSFHVDPAILIALCVLAVGFQSYATNYKTQYLQYKTNDTVEFFEDNLGENDIIVYNEPNTRWVYECYFKEDQLVFLSDMDFSQDCSTIWFMDSCCDPWLNDDLLTQNGLTKTYVGAYGIEYNDFSLYKITKM